MNGTESNANPRKNGGGEGKDPGSNVGKPDEKDKKGFSRADIEVFLRDFDNKLFLHLPDATIEDLQFMEDIMALMIKNIQTRKSFMIRFQERDLFAPTPKQEVTSEDLLSHQSNDVDISNEPDAASSHGEVEFDPPDPPFKDEPDDKPRKAPQQMPARKERVKRDMYIEEVDMGYSKKHSQPAAKPMHLEEVNDPRIQFCQSPDLPTNYLPVLSSSIAPLIAGRHYMLPALLDNAAFFVYGTCANCTVPDCRSCVKIKNPRNGVRIEMKMFLLNNQELTLVGFNKVVADGLHIPHAELIQMVKKNRDLVASQIVRLYMGHVVLFDKLYHGKALEEKEVTNAFVPTAFEVLAAYHQQLQI